MAKDTLFSGVAREVLPFAIIGVAGYFILKKMNFFGGVQDAIADLPGGRSNEPSMIPTADSNSAFWTWLNKTAQTPGTNTYSSSAGTADTKAIDAFNKMQLDAYNKYLDATVPDRKILSDGTITQLMYNTDNNPGYSGAGTAESPYVTTNNSKKTGITSKSVNYPNLNTESKSVSTMIKKSSGTATSLPKTTINLSDLKPTTYYFETPIKTSTKSSLTPISMSNPIINPKIIFKPTSQSLYSTAKKSMLAI